MTRTEFLALLNAYSMKCGMASVMVATGARPAAEVNNELIPMWQQISAAVVEHWCEPDTPPHPPSGGTLFP